MRTAIVWCVASVIGVLSMGSVSTGCATEGHPPDARPVGGRDDSAAEALGFKLGTQAWTWRDRTAYEAVEMAGTLGLHYIEFYPGQALKPEHKDVKVGPDMTADQRKALRAFCEEHHVKPTSFGVWGFKTDEKDARRAFDFARDMGIGTITCEPEDAGWDMVEKLANEYGIAAACHNHPNPSHYWNPDIVLGAIKSRGPRTGACADTGHWVRSGLVPVDCLKKYEGRIIELHFKDIKDGVDQPWGTGNGDVRGMLAELRRQKFTGLVALEYEDGSGAVLEGNAKKCVDFFDTVCREMVAAEKTGKTVGR